MAKRKSKKSNRNRLTNRCPLSGDAVTFDKVGEVLVTIIDSDYHAFCPFCMKVVKLKRHPLGGYHVRQIPIHKIREH